MENQNIRTIQLAKIFLNMPQKDDPHILTFPNSNRDATFDEFDPSAQVQKEAIPARKVSSQRAAERTREGEEANHQLFRAN